MSGLQLLMIKCVELDTFGDCFLGKYIVEECACVPREVSFRLPRNFGQPKATKKWVSLLLTRYSGQPLATMNWGGQP